MRRFSNWIIWYSLPYFLLIQTRFAGVQFKTLAGDDIYYLAGSRIDGGYGNSLLHSPLDQAYGKWRPIPQVIGSLLLDLFGGDFWKYQIFNEVLLAIVGTLLAILVMTFFPDAKLLSWAAGSFIILARFNLYNILQVLGMMESIALICCISTLIFLTKYSAANSRKYYVLFNLFFFLSVHSHERYMFLFPSLIWVITFYSVRKNPKYLLFLYITPIAILAENYLIKTLIFQTNFFTGGGAVPIDGSISNIMWFSWRGLLNIFGYNSGPDYLSGKNAHTIGNCAIYIAVLWAAPCLLLIIGAMLKMFKAYSITSAFKSVPVIIGTVLSLVLSASITFRQEYRWLLSPYLVLVLVVFVSIGFIFKSNIARGLVSLVLVVVGSINGLYYAKYSENTYFYMTQKLADSINDRIFVQYRSELDSASFIIIDHGSQAFDWAIGSGLFFDTYSPNDNYDIRRIIEADDLSAIVGLRESVYTFDYQWDQIVQLP